MKKFNSALSVALLLTGIALLGPVTAASASGTPTVTASVTTGLTDGSSVVVSGSGFIANDSLYILECLQGATGAAGCNTAKILATAAADASGNVASTIVNVFTGKVGTGSGSCGLTSADVNCWLVITSIDGSDKGYTPITFVAGSGTTTTTMAATTTTMAKPAAKKTITCVKGKVTKHVTTKACPAGYKKK